MAYLITNAMHYTVGLLFAEISTTCLGSKCIFRTWKPRVTGPHESSDSMALSTAAWHCST